MPFGHVDQERLGDRVARPAQEGVDHLFGVVAGGAGVPQPEIGQPVGVNVLGRPFELGEGRDVGPARRRLRVVDFEQQRPVGLDDERTVGHKASSSSSVITRAHAILLSVNVRVP